MAQTLSPFSGTLLSEVYRLRGTTMAFYSDVANIQKSRRLLRQDRGRQTINPHVTIGVVFREAAGYIDRILKGEIPAAFPIKARPSFD